MALKNAEEHGEDLKVLRPNVYIRGEGIDDVRQDRRLQLTLNLVGMHHDISFDPEMRALAPEVFPSYMPLRRAIR